MMSSRLLGVATLILAIVLGSSMAQGVVVVLKEGSELTTGGALDPVFSGISAASVVEVAVDDTAMVTNPAAYNNNGFGSATSWSPSSHAAYLFKFDLSSLPAGAVIEKAQLRLYETNGNSGVRIGRVATHDWTEASATRNSPVGLTSPSWGPNGDSIFSAADVDGMAAPESAPNGAAFTIKDVTADVQAFVNGTLPNYGWVLSQDATISTVGNRGYIPSESEDVGRRPALFISYTPEPGTLVLLAISGLALLRRRAA